MPELNDFLLHMKEFYKKNHSPNEEQMSGFIQEYALEKGENYTYELPSGGAFQVGGAVDRRAFPKYSAKTLEKLTQLLRELNAKVPPKPCIRLTPVREETTVFDSKLGGVPYLPKSMEYPAVREGTLAGRPLRLLAQLNFGTLPKLPGFPDSGILQFFAGCDGDDVVGVDFDDYFNQNGFRVIYHEQVIADTSQLFSAADMPQFDPEDYAFPFKGEFLLKASEPQLCAVTPEDHQFAPAVIECYNRLFGGNIVAMWGGRPDVKPGLRTVDEQLYNALYDSIDSTGSRIGGYPFFTQDDPRYAERYSGCDTLLFQLDSCYDGENEIIWGDSGVGAFFINSEDLLRREFSRVMYSWDCS